jgi:sensor domain CHASE-containing protein
MDTKTLFYIGITLGFMAGILLTLIVVKVKSLFSSSEVRRLTQEKRGLEKRIQEKEKYIDEMMGHAEKLAQDVSTRRPPDDTHP